MFIAGRVQKFVLILGRVSLGHLQCGSGSVRSIKLDSMVIIIKYLSNKLLGRVILLVSSTIRSLTKQ